MVFRMTLITDNSKRDARAYSWQLAEDTLSSNVLERTSVANLDI
jgi:hypothetical protein